MTFLSRAAVPALAFVPLLVAHAQAPVPQSAAAPSPLGRPEAPSAAPEQRLAPVVVTARDPVDTARQAAGAEAALTPGGVTLVDGDALRQRNVSSLADLLRYVPGVWAASGATGDGSFLSSRGSNLDATNYDGNGIVLLQDGLPVTAADGNNHNRDVDPLSASHAVVARGANALTYGASTLGGAIDFTTPTARDGAPNEAMVSGGSHAQRQARVTWGTVAGAFDALVSGEVKRSDGFRAHQRQAREGLYANAGWAFDATVRTRFYATLIDNDQQLPGALTRAEWQADPSQAQPAAVLGDYRYDVRTRRVANRTTWDVDAHTQVTAGLSHETQALYHPIVYTEGYKLLIDTEQRTTGGMVRVQRRAGDHDVLIGVHAGRTAVTGGEFDYQPGGAATRARRTDNAATSLVVFAVDRWRFAPDWTAVYGTQGVTGRRRIRTTADRDGAVRELSGTYDSLNPRIGILRDLGPTAQLFANVSRLHEAPTLYELEDDGRRDGSALDAMQGTVVEVGTRGTGEQARHRWHWDVSVYWARLRDEILSRDDPAAPGTSLSMNVGRTVHAGVEALLGGSLALDDLGAHRLAPLLNVTLNHFRFRGDPTYADNRLPAAPRVALRGELLYRHGSGFHLGPTFDVVGRRYADFANTYSVDRHVLWGLRAGLARGAWAVYAEGRNLGDRRHVAFFSVKDQAGADAAILTPGEPRSLYVGARLRF